MAWRPDDITFEIDPEGTEDPVVTVRFGTPAGEIQMMAEVEEHDRTLRLIGLHIQGLTPNEIGSTNLRVLADVVMSELDYDAIEVEGAPRTTGAGPGRRPRPIRFTRRLGPAAED
jgi:hypothetical protein